LSIGNDNWARRVGKCPDQCHYPADKGPAKKDGQALDGTGVAMVAHSGNKAWDQPDNKAKAAEHDEYDEAADEAALPLSDA
jgi:hypothetical protein